MADLHSVVVPAASSALQALTATTILRVPHTALRDAARLYPAIAEAFWRESAIDASSYLARHRPLQGLCLVVSGSPQPRPLRPPQAGLAKTSRADRINGL